MNPPKCIKVNIHVISLLDQKSQLIDLCFVFFRLCGVDFKRESAFVDSDSFKHVIQSTRKPLTVINWVPPRLGKTYLKTERQRPPQPAHTDAIKMEPIHCSVLGKLIGCSSLPTRPCSSTLHATLDRISSRRRVLKALE